MRSARLAPPAMHILVAEDDRDISDLISHYLKKAGWTTHVAPAGDQALAYIRNHPVDVVILDVMLPGMSGLEVCKALRGDRATAGVPVIMLTARADESDRIRGLEIGADDYVAKPFSPNELVARVRAVTRRTPAKRCGRSGAASGSNRRRSDETHRYARRARGETHGEGIHAPPVLPGAPRTRDLARHPAGRRLGIPATPAVPARSTSTSGGCVKNCRRSSNALATIKQFGYKLLDDEAS